MKNKFLIPIAAGLALITLLVAFLLPRTIEKAMVQSTIEEAKSTVSQYKTLRGYYTKNVVAKAKAAGMTPHYNHKTMEGAIPLPATMIHDLSELVSKSGIELKLYSAFPFPNRAGRTLDDYQQSAWKALKNAPNDVYVERMEKNGQHFMRIAVADTMSADACVACHNGHPETPKRDWQLGDVRGILEVVKPLDQVDALVGTIRIEILVGAVISLILISLLITVLFRTVVLNRVEGLHQAIGKLASGEGDLTAKLPEGSQDEIGAIAHQFNRFLDTFREIVSGAVSIAAQVNQSSQTVLQATHRIQANMNDQGKQASLIATAATEMCSSVKDISQHAEEASDSTRQANGMLETSMRDVGSTATESTELAENMSKSKAVITRLSDESNQIGSILDVIKAIAEQTNLLALNAAIEAARAGEQGRGFAVVADEVRALAHRTQQSIEEIQRTVENLQSMASEAVHDVTTGEDKAVRMSTNINQVNQQLKDAISLESGVYNAIASIASAMEEQTAVSEDMDRNVLTLKDHTDSNSEALHEIAQQIKEAHEQVTRLNNQLSRFTV